MNRGKKRLENFWLHNKGKHENFKNTYFKRFAVKETKRGRNGKPTYNAAEFAAVHFTENTVAHLLDEAHSADGELTSAHLRLHVRA